LFKEEIFEKNLLALKKTQPELWRWISSNIDLTEVVKKKVKVNKFNLPDFELSHGYLMEDIDLKAYVSWIRTIKNSKLLVLIGSSLGYGIAILNKEGFKSNLIVVEPDPYLLFASLGISDFSYLIRNKKLLFATSLTSHLRSAFERFIPYILHSQVKIVLDWVNLKIGEKYKEAFERAKSVLKDTILSVSTIRRRQEETIENEIQNFKRIFTDGSLFPLKGKLKDFYCMVIGAGPSLEENYELIKFAKQKIITASAFQTLPVLYRFNLKPSFAMALDYTATLLKVYDKIPLKWLEDIPLIYSPKINPEVLSKYPGMTIPVWTTGGLGTYVNPKKDIVIESGGNVSVAIIRLLYEFGIKEFFLIGQDFSWRSESTHSKGHHASEEKFKYDPKEHIKITNRYGETIYTAGPYLSAVHEIEKDIEEKHLKIYNLYDRGVEIKGSAYLDPKDFITFLDKVDKNQEALFLKFIKECKQPRPLPKIDFESEIWHKSLSNVEKRLKKLYKRYTKNQQEIKQVYNEILIFLAQHPIYTPYIHNEMLELSLFSSVKDTFLPADFRKTSKILKSIKEKVKKIDKKLKEALLK